MPLPRDPMLRVTVVVVAPPPPAAQAYWVETRRTRFTTRRPFAARCA